VSLPKFNLPRETVTIDGEFIEIRGLTRAEAATLQKMVADGVAWDHLERAVIAYGTEHPPDEVAEWYRTVPAHVADQLSSAIKTLSRLDEEAQKSSGESDRARG